MACEMNIAYIRWKDAAHGLEECRVDEIDQLCDLHEVGFLVKETDESVTLSVEHQDGATSARLWLTIPRVNIVEMRTASVDKAFPVRRKAKK